MDTALQPNTLLELLLNLFNLIVHDFAYRPCLFFACGLGSLLREEIQNTREHADESMAQRLAFP